MSLAALALVLVSQAASGGGDPAAEWAVLDGGSPASSGSVTFTLPPDAVPEVAVPEVAVPEVAVPEVAVPEVAVPEAPPQPDAGLQEVSDGGGALELPSFESTPVQAAPSGPGPVRASVYALVDAQLGVDTAFEPPPPDAFAENVSQARARARLGADVQLSERFRVRAEARVDWRLATQAGFSRTKAVFEPSVGETYLDGYFPAFDLRIGIQEVPLGANAVFAPADVFNPRNLTQSLLAQEPESLRVPIFAIRGQGELGPVKWLLAYAPFFEPDRFSLFGQDESLWQPGWGSPVPANPVDPSIEDLLQPRLVETRRPEAFGVLGDLAAQASVDLAGTRVGASWVWAWEKLPQLTVDPELQALLAQLGRGEEPSPALLLSLQSRLRAGETLYQGVYGRQHVFSVQATRLVGPVQVDVDVGFTPTQTFFTDAFDAIRRPSLTWVLGLSPAEDSEWSYAVGYVGQAIFGLAADELIPVLEPATARGAARTGFLHLLFANVGRKLLDDRLELAVRVAFEPIQLSYALGPRVSWRAVDPLWVWLGAEIYQGPAVSPFGYFGRNDQVLAGVRWQP